MRILALSLLLSTASLAQQQVTVYCPLPGDWCKLAGNDFEKATGITVNVLKKSAGEVLAQMRAEKSNPKGDIWWGGISDGHFAAAQEGLTLPVENVNLTKLAPWAQGIYAQSNKHAVGVYSLALGFGYNPELALKKGFKPPACWSDLTKPEYKGELQMANPNSSGTAYQVIASLVQIMGEEPAFDYLKKLHMSINAYPRSGVAPSKAVSRGETGVALTYLQDAFVESNAGLPIKTIVPCEGTALGIDALSMIKGGPNKENAVKLYNWLLSAEGQSTSMKAGMMHTPAHIDATQPPTAALMKDVKLINYDYKAYGNSARRSHLIKRWEDEVNSIAK
jgi:iron(III) transport system substrate-binding protein